MLGLIPSSVCVWLIRVGDRWTLVDSGPPEGADTVVAAVARATHGRGPQTILLTHAHPDHAGGLEALRAAWDPAILCHRDEVGFVTGQSDYRRLAPRGLGFSIGRHFMGRSTWALPVAHDLERGQAVEGMAIIHLPGHTPGHIGFLHPEDRAMLCGDALLNVGGGSPRRRPWRRRIRAWRALHSTGWPISTTSTCCPRTAGRSWAAGGAPWRAGSAAPTPSRRTRAGSAVC